MMNFINGDILPKHFLGEENAARLEQTVNYEKHVIEYTTIEPNRTEAGFT